MFLRIFAEANKKRHRPANYFVHEKDSTVFQYCLFLLYFFCAKLCAFVRVFSPCSAPPVAYRADRGSLNAGKGTRAAERGRGGTQGKQRQVSIAENNAAQLTGRIDKPKAEPSFLLSRSPVLHFPISSNFVSIFVSIFDVK